MANFFVQAQWLVDLKQSLMKQPLRSLPWLWMSLWILVPLLSGFFDLEHQRLIAHDEGLYATRARTMLMQQDWIHPWETVHHKTPGSYWILASMFQVFGVNEVTARLPSVVASVVCGMLVYELARELLTREIAGWSVLSISTAFLWVQSGRLATPDMPFIALFLAGLGCLLKAETSARYGRALRLTAGLCWGLAFLVRSFLILLPIAALLPYLVLDHRRHRHLASPSLYLGASLGLLPTLLWLWACWHRFGHDIFQSLMDFPVRKAARGDDPMMAGSVFYLTSLQLNSLPWGLFSLLGLGVFLQQRPTRRQVLLVGGFVAVTFGILSLSSTHLHHYALVIYPFLAMLAGIALEWICTSPSRWARRCAMALAILFGSLGGLLIVISGVVSVLSPATVEFVSIAAPYRVLALVLGVAWSASSLVWMLTGRRDRWLVGLLIANWLALSMAGASGRVGNGDLALKRFLLQPEIQSVLNNHTVHFAGSTGKLSVLLRFYTPHPGIRVLSADQLPATGFAWIWAADQNPVVTPPARIDQFNEVALVQLGTETEEPHR